MIFWLKNGELEGLGAKEEPQFNQGTEFGLGEKPFNTEKLSKQLKPCDLLFFFFLNMSANG